MYIEVLLTGRIVHDIEADGYALRGRVDPLIAMKIVGHSNCQTTANVYTHIKDQMLKKATVNMEDVFKKREA